VTVNVMAPAQPLDPIIDSTIITTGTNDEVNNALSGQNNLYTVRNIIITGNKKTHPNIIMRELSFGINEAYPLDEISSKFQKARKQLMNTGLFMNVTVALKSMNGNDVYVNIEVEEKWYIWPKPFLRTVDKTFHEWWNEKDRDMNRINYGLRLTHNNFTGRNDKLKLNFMNGYTRQLSIRYYNLYLDNDLKWSVNGGISIGKNREVNYITEQNKPVPIKDNDRFMRTYFHWFGEINYRPAIKTTHTFGIGYSYENIADTVYKLNPGFSPGTSAIRYPEMFYRMSYFDVDFIPYPTRGFIGELMLRKKGFNSPVQLWQFTAKGSKTWPVGSKYFFNASAVGMLKLPLKQPYITNQFLGHDGQYMQGYEYYVIDGVAGGYSKATLSRQLVNTRIRINTPKLSRLHHIPLKIYAKTYMNAGYVHCANPGSNEFNNRLLYSGGVGLDIIVFTDFIIKLDWSFNRLGENGLYLHKRNYF
ncbi:MAG TPA: POTRA domain-containing protein, partial [Flavisolibacter sp.]